MNTDKVIQSILDNTDYTFESLAKALDITPSYLKALETGEKPLSHILKKRLMSLNKAKKQLKEELVSKEKETSESLKEVIEFLSDEESLLEKDFLMDEEN